MIDIVSAIVFTFFFLWKWLKDHSFITYATYFEKQTFLRGHPLSTYGKFSEKTNISNPRYAHVRVRIRGLEMLVFPKILRTYLMDDP